MVQHHRLWATFTVFTVMGLSIVVEKCSVRSHTLSMLANTRDHQWHLIPPTPHTLKIVFVSRRKESMRIDICTRMLKVQITLANHTLSVNSIKATKCIAITDNLHLANGAGNNYGTPVLILWWYSLAPKRDGKNTGIPQGGPTKQSNWQRVLKLQSLAGWSQDVRSRFRFPPLVSRLSFIFLVVLPRTLASLFL
jgi:hypothetical protein